MQSNQRTPVSDVMPSILHNPRHKPSSNLVRLDGVLAFSNHLARIRSSQRSNADRTGLEDMSIPISKVRKSVA